MNPNNENLAKIFDQLVIQFKNDRWRTRAYKNAAQLIRNHQGTILSGEQAQKEIKGIGKSIAAKIDEFLTRGVLTVIETQSPEEKEKIRVTQLFEGIHGVGLVTAEKWYNQGLRTLEDIKTIYHELTDAQKLGYCYYHHIKQRIPRREIDKYNSVLTKVMKNINAEFLICGSYRRGEETSGDIDCLVKGAENINIGRILRELVKSGIIVGHLAIGSAKYMGIVRLGEKYCARRLDILVSAEECWPYATLYFTGSKQLNIKMRSKALQMGMKMDEYGMVKADGSNYPANTEEDIFQALGMSYIPPTQRSIGQK